MNIKDVIESSSNMEKMLTTMIKREDGSYSKMVLSEAIDLSTAMQRYNVIDSIHQTIKDVIINGRAVKKYVDIDMVKEAYKPSKDVINNVITEYAVDDLDVYDVVVYIDTEVLKIQGLVDQITVNASINGTNVHMNLLKVKDKPFESKNILNNRKEAVEAIRDIMLAIINKEYASGLKSIEANRKNSKERIKGLLTKAYNKELDMENGWWSNNE